MSSAQTPHDVVIALADLKRMLAWLTSAIVAAFVAVLISYNVRITQVEAKTSSLHQVAEYAKEERSRIQKSVDASVAGQQKILDQVADLRPKVAAIEEISRSTQSRVEALTEYMKKSANSSNALINNYDTVRATRP